MEDRELLELAAKAAGFVFNNCKIDGALWGCFEDTPSQVSHPWNPLADDGDALRLAVKLGLSIHVGAIHVSVEFNGTWSEETSASDIYAATRRAIVLAAAEIGRTS